MSATVVASLWLCANAGAVGGPGVTYTTSVTANPNPVDVGQTVTLTATATASDGSDPGAVQFTSSPYSYDGNCSNQPVTLVGGEYQATCVTSFIRAGQETITATVTDEYNNTTATRRPSRADHDHRRAAANPTGCGLAGRVRRIDHGG
jgi:hypothetical protein